MLYGHVHDTLDERLLNDFIKQTRQTTKMGMDGVEHPVRLPHDQLFLHVFRLYASDTG